MHREKTVIKTKKIINYFFIILNLYLLTLLVQWIYDYNYTLKILERDITNYNADILNEVNRYRFNIEEYRKIYIISQDIDRSIWTKWNIFNWSESKYIKKENRKEILFRLNFWRKTGKLPTFYNLNIKSV